MGLILLLLLTGTLLTQLSKSIDFNVTTCMNNYSLWKEDKTGPGVRPSFSRVATDFGCLYLWMSKVGQPEIESPPTLEKSVLSDLPKVM